MAGILVCQKDVYIPLHNCAMFEMSLLYNGSVVWNNFPARPKPVYSPYESIYDVLLDVT